MTIANLLVNLSV